MPKQAQQKTVDENRRVDNKTGAGKLGSTKNSISEFSILNSYAFCKIIRLFVAEYVRIGK